MTPTRAQRIGSDDGVIEMLNVPAQQIRAGDAVTEGTVVRTMTLTEEDVRNPLTGEISREMFVTLELIPARIIVVDDTIPGVGHVHDWDLSSRTEVRYRFDEQVRIGRPAPMQPCPSCGFPDTQRAPTA